MMRGGFIAGKALCARGLRDSPLGPLFQNKLHHHVSQMLGQTSGDLLRHCELYSCFPVAVRHASLQLGVPFVHAPLQQIRSERTAGMYREDYMDAE